MINIKGKDLKYKKILKQVRSIDSQQQKIINYLEYLTTALNRNVVDNFEERFNSLTNMIDKNTITINRLKDTIDPIVTNWDDYDF